MNNFKVTKCGKYFRTELIKSTNELIAKITKDREEKESAREEEMKDVKVGDKVLIPSASSKKDEPDIPAVVEELVEENAIKVRVHDKLLVEVPKQIMNIRL